MMGYINKTNILLVCTTVRNGSLHLSPLQWPDYLLASCSLFELSGYLHYGCLVKVVFD